MTDTAAPGQIRKPNVTDGLLLVVLGCVWGSAFLPIKIAVPETGPLLLVFGRVLCALVPLWLYMIVSAVVLAPFVILTGPASIAGLSINALLAVAYLGVVPTGLGYLLRYHMVLTVGQSYMSMASYIMPIVGVVLGVVFLSEPVTANLIIALALVLGGFAFARFGG